MKRLIAIPVRAPRLTLAVMAAITLALGIPAQRVRIDSSIENLLPAHDADRVYYEEVRRVFGSEEVTVIGVFADDVFAPRTLAKIADLSQRLAALDGVREVLSLSTVKAIEAGDFGLSITRLMTKVPESPAEAAALRSRVFANPLYLKNVVSADGTAAGITVVFEPMTGDEFIQRGLEDAIRTLVDAAQGPERLALTGIPTIKVNGARLMETDIATFMPLALLLVVAVLVWGFRTPRGVLVPLATVGLAIVWTLGFMVLTGGAITMGTLVLPPLLITIGIASSIHVVSQYYQEIRPGRTAAEVVRHAMGHVAVPIAVCELTTLVGFAPFALSPIRAIFDFGVYALFGVTIILVATFALPPAVLTLLPVPARVPAIHGADGWLTRFLDRFSSVATLRPRLTLALVLLVTSAAAWGVRHVKVETDYLSFFSPRSAVRADNALVAERLAGTQPIYVVIDGSAPESATRLDTVRAMRVLQDFIDAQPGVDKTLSLADYLALVRSTLQPGATGLPQTQNEIDQLLLLVSPKDVQTAVNRDFSRANILVRTRLSSSEDVGAFVRRVEAFAAERFPRDVHVHATGTIVLLNRSADTLAWGEIQSLWQVVVVLLGVMSVLFLSLRVGLISLIPNVVPIVVLYGIMGWMGISLNISTAMIASIAIGIAVDDTIHLFSAFNAAVKRTGSQEEAIAEVMHSVGRAITFTTVALVAGFLIVCLSSFEPVRYFGALSAVTVAVGIVVELLVTPALLATTKIITAWDLLRLRLGREPHKQIPLFAGLRPFQAKIVVLMGELTTAARGTAITRRGEMRAELYVLLAGRAEVRRGDDGPALRTLARGDVVGEMGLVRQCPRSADVLVTEDAEYLVLHEDFLRRLRRRYPRIASTVLLNLCRILSDRVESTTDLLAARAAPRPRVAAGA